VRVLSALLPLLPDLTLYMQQPCLHPCNCDYDPQRPISKVRNQRVHVLLFSFHQQGGLGTTVSKGAP